MNLVASLHYDPSTAVTKATSALLAMTALDTTNLRLNFTVPPSGKVFVKIRGGAIHGATTFPMILVGVLESSTVRGRSVPMGGLLGTALATTFVPVEVEFIVTGLTPGASLNWDVAYGVETIVAATGWKYGGPNNTTANDAWGGISFQIWDAQPITQGAQLGVDTNGRVDVSKVLGATINALVSGRVDASVGAMANSVITAAAHAAGAIDANAIAADAIGSSELASSAVAEIVAAIWDELTSVGRVAGSYGQLLKDDINATISSRAAPGAAMALVVDAVDSVAVASSGANEIADALLDRASAVEGFTVRQILRLMAAAMFGKASGFPGGPVNYRDIADTKNRIQATVSSGNRSAVTLDAT